ncbi:hypothetical protein Plhal304r1_c031g0100141 [Plasmopara halstedii]
MVVLRSDLYLVTINSINLIDRLAPLDSFLLERLWLQSIHHTATYFECVRNCFHCRIIVSQLEANDLPLHLIWSCFNCAMLGIVVLSNDFVQ